MPDTASRSGLFYQKTSAGYRGRSGLGEEIGQRGPGPLRIILHRDVAGAGHRDEVRMGHLLFEAARRQWAGTRLPPSQEQRRQAHLFERSHQLMGVSRIRLLGHRRPEAGAVLGTPGREVVLLLGFAQLPRGGLTQRFATLLDRLVRGDVARVFRVVAELL